MSKRFLLLVAAMILCMSVFVGCSGDDGKDGKGLTQEEIDEIKDEIKEGLDSSIASIKGESCGICHNGNTQPTGASHQAKYADYADESTLAVEVTAAAIDTAAGTASITFTLEENGAPVDVDVAEFGTGGRFKGNSVFYINLWDDTMKGFRNKTYLSVASVTKDTTEAFAFTNNGSGSYTVTKTGIPFPTEHLDGSTIDWTKPLAAYVVITADPLDMKYGSNQMYDNVAEDLYTSGAISYTQTANVDGCEKCHGAPYMKHVRLKAIGLADASEEFLSCKMCHQADRVGSHQDWQVIKDNPKRYAEVHNGVALTSAEKTQYAYTANLMNDVHQSHAFEFAYPQRMQNCVTCHEGKLDEVLDNKNFRIDVCKSCHPVNGGTDTADKDGNFAVDTTEFALNTLANKNLPGLHNFSDPGFPACTQCHTNTYKSFKSMHTGYDPRVYAADGTKYDDAINATIDSVSEADGIVEVKVSVTGNAGDIANTDIAPMFMISAYGYDTKNFLITGHGSVTLKCNDGTEFKPRLAEFKFGTDTLRSDCAEHPVWEEITGEGNGKFTVKFKHTYWADKVEDGSVKRIEFAVLPAVGKDVPNKSAIGISAVSKTIDVATNSFDDQFATATEVVDVTKCNACHDQLATTFHSGNYGGSLVVCRMCHVPASGGSHLEMQSRSIDSYVHAIHALQPFDTKNVDFSDDVEAVAYEHHAGSTYPYFTLNSCESCHKAGTYDIPDQAKSMPSVLSKADTINGKDRNIGAVPSYVTGPASRACGSCHRSYYINTDQAGKLATLNVHTDDFGYLKEAETGVFDAVVKRVMGIFQ